MPHRLRQRLPLIGDGWKANSTLRQTRYEIPREPSQAASPRRSYNGIREVRLCVPAGLPRFLAPPGARMCGVVDPRQMLEIQVCINLCSGNICMAEQFLHGAQVA